MRRRVVTTVRRFKRLVLAICLAAWLAALVATHIPAGELPEVHVSDKTLHAAGFFALASLLWLSLAAYGVRRLRRVVVVVCAVIVYAAVDETTQGWFQRNPDVFDWLADVVGAAVAVCALEFLSRLTGWMERPAEPPPDDRYTQYPY